MSIIDITIITTASTLAFVGLFTMFICTILIICQTFVKSPPWLMIPSVAPYALFSFTALIFPLTAVIFAATTLTFSQLPFVIYCWEENKKPFKISLIGLSLYFVGVLMICLTL